MMDKKGMIFGKINIIDLAAIIIAVLAIVGITMRFISIAAENVKRETDFSYVVEVEDIRIYSVDALSKKGTATDKQGNVIGEITDVACKDMERQVVLENGNSQKVKVPEKFVARITIDATGKDTDGGYFVGENTELSVGSSITMYTKYANCSGRIVKVNKKNQG